jgi:hypothetical protein
VSITLELTPEEESLLREAAASEGKDVATLVRQRVFGTAANVAPRPLTDEEITERRRRAVDGHVDPDGSVYRIDEIPYMLDTLPHTVEPVSDEQWEAFKRGIDEARPGQRSIFGEGINPYQDDAPDER